MKIVMLEPIAVSEELLLKLSAPLREKGHVVELCSKPLGEEEKMERAKDADVLIIANSPLDEKLLSPTLKMISVAFTGIDHLPKQACADRNILVSNAQGYATVAVTELVYGLLFACMRNLLPCDGATRKGLTKEGLVGNELCGKTMGIVGYGAIGKSVAQIARAFGCSVVAYSRSAKPDEDGVRFLPLNDVMAQSDVVSLHVPLTDETRRLIDREKIALMKPSAILINTARGGVVDPVALAEALNDGKIAGAGIDVFDIEPPLAPDEPLFKAKNTVLAPHVGFATKESMVKRANIVFENVFAWLDGNPINVKI